MQDSGEKLLSVTNIHLITLRLILTNGNNLGTDEDFVINGCYANTTAYNIMIHRIKTKGLSNRQPYPQGHILSREEGLLASSYANDRERRFIVGVTSYLESHALTGDSNHKAQMRMKCSKDNFTFNTVKFNYSL